MEWFPTQFEISIKKSWNLSNNLLKWDILQLGNCSSNLEHVSRLSKVNPTRKANRALRNLTWYSLPCHGALHHDETGQNSRGNTRCKKWSISLQQQPGQRNHLSHIMQMGGPGLWSEYSVCSWIFAFTYLGKVTKPVRPILLPGKVWSQSRADFTSPKIRHKNLSSFILI